MDKLLIIGAGGHGKVVADCALASGLWKSIAFIDDRYDEMGDVLGFPVIGPIKDTQKFRHSYPQAVTALGDNRLRIEIQNKLESLGFEIASVIHPTASVGTGVEIGDGTVVFAKAVINPDSTIGRGCIVNTAASIDHDCKLDDGVHISPGVNLAGGVEIGRYSRIGIGAVVIQGCKIMDDVVIGAGAAVTGDVRGGVTAVGVPAKVISESR